MNIMANEDFKIAKKAYVTRVHLSNLAVIKYSCVHKSNSVINY